MKSISISCLLICTSHALEFGERDFRHRMDTFNLEATRFLDSFLTNPQEIRKTKQSYYCHNTLSSFKKTNTVIWLNVFLHVALHVTQLYNVGLYQDINIGRVCLHKLNDELKKVSFPDSPMIVHDLGTVTLPQTAPYSSNHRILHPFEDFANFARPDRHGSIPSWRFVKDLNIANIIFSSPPFEFLSSFSKEAQQRLLVPLHPIYMVRDLYYALLTIKAPALKKDIFTRMEDQIRFANLYLSSPIPLPLPTDSGKPFRAIPTLPSSVTNPGQKKPTPLILSVDMLLIDDYASSSTSFSLNSNEMLPLTSPSQINNPDRFNKNSVEPEGSEPDAFSKPIILLDDQEATENQTASGPTIKKFSFLRSGHKSVHQGLKMIAFDKANKAHNLRKNKKLNAFILNKKEIYKRVFAKKMIEVTPVDNYFTGHPFFSSFIQKNDPTGKSYFSIRQLIRTVCFKHRKVQAPLLDVVCKKDTTTIGNLNIFRDQPTHFRPLLLSWFGSFLSGQPHSLDGFQDAPSLLKAQLLILIKATLSHLENRPQATNDDPLTFQHERYTTAERVSPLIIKQGRFEMDVFDQWFAFYKARKISDVRMSPLPNVVKDPFVIKTDERMTRERVRMPLQEVLNLRVNNRILLPNPAKSNDPMPLVNNQVTSEVKNNQETSEVKKRVKIQLLDINSAYYGCGLIFSALLHYFALISTPPPHTSPLPQMLSLLQGQSQFDFKGVNRDLLPNIPVIKEISQLYNHRFFSSIGINSSVSSHPHFCLIQQYLSRDCQNSVDAFHSLKTAPLLKVQSASFLLTASRLYEQSVILSSLLSPITKSMKHSSTLSLFYSVSIRLAELKNIDILKNDALFAFFITYVTLDYVLTKSLEDFLEYFCDKENFGEHGLPNYIYNTFNFYVHKEFEFICYKSSASVFQETFEFSSAFYIKLRSLKEYWRNDISDNLFHRIVIYSVFTLRDEILAGNEKVLQQQHPLLFLATPDGNRLWNEFLHDAALLQTIGSSSQELYNDV